MTSSSGESSPLIRQLIDSQDVVSEPVLIEIAKGPLKDFIASSNDLAAVEKIRASLIRTYSSSNLSTTHRAAICRNISLLFELALRSRETAIHKMLLSEECWLSTFEAFVDRYDQCKPKAIRQTLNTLTRVIEQHPDQETGQAIISSVTPLLVRILMFGDSPSHVRASLVCLEFFFRKNLISISRLALSTHERLNRPDQASELVRARCEEIGVASTEDYHEKYALQAFITAAILGAIGQPYLSSVGYLCSQLIQKLKRESQGASSHDGVPFWVQPLRNIALANLDFLNSLCLYVFRPLFSADPSALHVFIQILPLRVLMLPGESVPEDQLRLLLAILVIAKDFGAIEEETDIDAQPAVSTSENNNNLTIPSARIGDFITHLQPEIRLLALSLLIKAPATSKPLSANALVTLREKLPYVQADPDPHYRGEVISLIRALFVRLRGGMIKLHRESQLDTKDSATSMSVDTHVHFLEWYISSLQGELHPAASYQRHITALHLLLVLAQTGLDSRIEPTNLGKIGLAQTPWPRSVTIFSNKMLRLLGDLTTDAFDDVRGYSSVFLGLFPREMIGDSSPSDSGKNSLLSQLQTGITRAEQLASSTSRADHTDTVGRLYQIVFNITSNSSTASPVSESYLTPTLIVDKLLIELKDILNSTDENLRKAMIERPFHGYISSMRFIICSAEFYTVLRSPSGDAYDYPQFHKTIMSLCTQTWLGVRDILCVDSPEGQQHEEPVEDLGPKDLLSCSWRALRESSLLLHAILTKAPKSALGCLSYDDLSAIGSLSFTQLAELRHRGAFSTVAQTFAATCERAGRASDSKSRELPSLWYDQFQETLHTQSSKLTRRSAGLPAVITGIALAEPDTSFRTIVHDLQLLVNTPLDDATDGNARRKLPQVHALNCLKDIFVNTRLAPWTEKHTMPTLKIAADCLGSEIWAIRNCGLMLFHSLMKRMCHIGHRNGGFGGVSGAEPGCRIAFGKKPELVPLLSSLLDPSVSGESDNKDEESVKSWELSSSTERVFPALELIGEKVPAANPDHDSVFRDLASRQFRSPVWAIRDHAARICAALTDPASTVSHINNYIESLSLQTLSQNEIHGHALCIRFSLARVWASDPPMWTGSQVDPIPLIEKTFATLFDSKYSPYILSTVIHILGDAMVTKTAHHQEESVVSLYERLSSRHQFDSILRTLFSPTASSARSSSLLLRATAHCRAVYLLITKRVDETITFLISLTQRDVDASRWILEQLHEKFASVKIFLFGKLAIYANFSGGDYPEAIRTSAMENLARELLSSYSRETDIPEIFSFVRSHDFTSVYQGSRVNTISNRNFFNGSLFLQGCVLPLKIQVSKDPSSLQRLNSYCHELAFAAHDETDFSTRHAAVLSLKTFFYCARLLGLITSQNHSFFFDLYLVLYDTLNDDDEELRDIGADAASMILSEWNKLHGNPAVGKIVPLAAADQFIAFLGSCTTSDDDDSMRTLSREVRNRVLGDALNNGFLLPVSNILSSIDQQKTALFEEEKQNLFIDDICEVKRWSDLLASVTFADRRKLVLELYPWVSSGLSVLTEALKPRGTDGLLGWTSKADIYVLGMRILYITQALFKQKNPGDANYSQAHLRMKVQNFIRSAYEADAHSDWISLAEKVLE